MRAWPSPSCPPSAMASPSLVSRFWAHSPGAGSQRRSSLAPPSSSSLTDTGSESSQFIMRMWLALEWHFTIFCIVIFVVSFNSATTNPSVSISSVEFRRLVLLDQSKQVFTLVINSSQVDQRQAGVRYRQQAASPTQGPVGVLGPHRWQHLRLPKFRVEWGGESDRICA